MVMRLAVKVYYEDTDCLGVVYYANYLKYFERGRSEYISARGKPIEVWNTEGYNFVVYKVTVTFHKPAKLGDVCDVVTRVVPKSPYRLHMKQHLERGGEMLTEAVVQLVCLDEDLELREFPDLLLAHAEEQQRQWLAEPPASGKRASTRGSTTCGDDDKLEL